MIGPDFTARGPRAFDGFRAGLRHLGPRARGIRSGHRGGVPPASATTSTRGSDASRASRCAIAMPPPAPSSRVPARPCSRRRATRALRARQPKALRRAHGRCSGSPWALRRSRWRRPTSRCARSSIASSRRRPPKRCAIACSRRAPRSTAPISTAPLPRSPSRPAMASSRRATRRRWPLRRSRRPPPAGDAERSARAHPGRSRSAARAFAPPSPPADAPLCRGRRRCCCSARPARSVTSRGPTPNFCIRSSAICRCLPIQSSSRRRPAPSTCAGASPRSAATSSCARSRPPSAWRGCRPRPNRRARRHPASASAPRESSSRRRRAPRWRSTCSS